MARSHLIYNGTVPSWLQSYYICSRRSAVCRSNRPLLSLRLHGYICYLIYKRMSKKRKNVVPSARKFRRKRIIQLYRKEDERTLYKISVVLMVGWSIAVSEDGLMMCGQVMEGGTYHVESRKQREHNGSYRGLSGVRRRGRNRNEKSADSHTTRRSPTRSPSR